MHQNVDLRKKSRKYHQNGRRTGISLDHSGSHSPSKTDAQIYANIDQISKLPLRGSLGLMNALRENKDVAFLSKTLATIVCSVDEDSESFSSVSLSDLSLRKIDQVAFSTFLNN